MNKIKKIIKEKSIKLRKLPSCQINHGSKHLISNNSANDSNLLNDNLKNNIINNNLNLMNDNLSQSQRINFRVGYISYPLIDFPQIFDKLLAYNLKPF